MYVRALFLFLLLQSQAQVLYALDLPYLFSTGMVLQRNAPIRIWGRGQPGEQVIVQLKQQTQSVATNTKGHWQVQLEPEPAGGPFTLIVKGKTETRRFEDVLVGEVWVCSGQSNMEWDVASSINAQQETEAARFPLIRQFDVPNKVAFTPQWNTDSASWTVCSPQTAARFSAVAYFFARKLYNELKIPIGLINSTWGGTVAEAWTSNAALKTHPDFKSNRAPQTEVEYQNIKAAQYKTLINKFQGSDVVPEQQETWSAIDFNADKWPFLTVDKQWEDQSLLNFDGTVWYRTTIDLNEAQAAQTATLHLGAIDDADITFINGKYIGNTNQWNLVRTYQVPTGVLQKGSNVLLVKVMDGGGGGGFYGTGERILQFGNGEKITLPLRWQAQVAKGVADSRPNPNDLPASLFNGMIAPITNYTIRGAIWYQGESNADRPKQYETLFPLLISDWRQQWKQGAFPFYFAQLSSFDPEHKPIDAPSNWALLRDAQRKTLSLPGTGLAVTIDIGERDDIHPKNKQDVGLRLALIALAKTYGKAVEYSGPVMQRVSRSGNNLTVTFAHAAGLSSRGGDQVEGFELVSNDHKIIPLKCRIEKGKVVLSLPLKTKPLLLRYAWHDDAGAANLKNGAGLPAVPFEVKL